MSDEAGDLAFCCYGVLKCRDRVERIAELLAEPRRQRIRDGIRQVSELGPRELKDRLEQVRASSADEQLQRAAAAWLPGRSGAAMGALSPALQRWLCTRFQESHGRANH